MPTPPCLITDERANTFRIEGGIKLESQELIGNWMYIKTVYQGYTEGGKADLIDWGKEYQRRNSVFIIDSDSISDFQYPFYKKYTCALKVDEDSLYIVGDTQQSHHYHGAANAYEFHEDTLVLISSPDGPCGHVIYEYYMHATLDDSIIQVLYKNQVNWKEAQLLWKFKPWIYANDSLSIRHKTWEDYSYGLPETIDLRPSNSDNFQFSNDLLFYTNKDSTYGFKFFDLTFRNYNGNSLDLRPLGDLKGDLLIYRNE